MKKYIISASIILSAIGIASCAPNGTSGGGFGLFDAKVVAGNANYVTVSDPVGIPGKKLNIATNHCSGFGKSATYQTEGGDSFECSGNTFCTTYQCISN